MSANHLSREATGKPVSSDQWPHYLKYLVEKGYLLTLGAGDKGYFVVLQGPNDFQANCGVTDVKMWLPACLTHLYAEVLRHESEVQKQKGAENVQTVVEEPQTISTENGGFVDR